MNKAFANFGERIAAAIAWTSLSFAIGAVPADAQPDMSKVRSLQLPPFKAGELLTFSYNMKYWNDGSFSQGLESETFDIKVLNVTASDARILWTLRTEAGSEYATFENVPIELQVDPSGVVQDITNFDSIKNHLFESHFYDASQFPDVASQKKRIGWLFSHILQAMAILQSRQAMTFGHNDLDTVKTDYGSELEYSVARSIDLIGVDQARCRASFVRHTVQTCRSKGHPCDSPIDTETSATVSMADGWVVELHSLEKFAPHFRQTVAIYRLTPDVCESASHN